MQQALYNVNTKNSITIFIQRIVGYPVDCQYYSNITGWFQLVDYINGKVSGAKTLQTLFIIISYLPTTIPLQASLKEYLTQLIQYHIYSFLKLCILPWQQLTMP